jgi:flagellar hook-length control protein FliK
MHSEQISASQLLSAFMGSESDKISQGVGRSDFAGELKKLIKEPAGKRGELSKNASSNSENLNVFDAGSKASGEQAAGEAKTRGQSASRAAQKAVIDASAKAKELKSKAKAAESVFVSNTAVANTILADLQYPAETRQACKALQNKEGEISVKELKSLLDAQPSVSSAIPAVVPAEHVQDLVNSIIAKGSGAEKQGSLSGTLRASVKVKAKGTYTRSEVLGLLDKVLQHVESEQAKPVESTASSASSAPSGLSQTAARVSGSVKAGQTRGLTASALPSFVSEDTKHSLESKTLAMEVKNPESEAKTINVAGAGGEADEAVANNLETLKTPNGAAYSREASTQAKAAGNESSAEKAPDSAAALSSAGKKTDEVPTASLDSVLKSFGAKIISSEPQQAEDKIIEAPVIGGSAGASVAQAQNIASHVKGAEKEADRSLGAQSASRQTQNSAENSETVQLKATPSEQASSDRSFDGDKKDAFEQVPKTDARTVAEKFDSNTIAVDAEATGNTDRQAAAVKPAQTGSFSDDSVETLAHGADSPAAVLKKAAEDSAGADAKTGETAGSTSEELRMGLGIEDSQTASNPSVYGLGEKTGLSLNDSLSATSRADSIETAESRIALTGADAVSLAKQIVKQSRNSDSTLEGTVFQNSAFVAQNSNLNVARAENSAQNGSAYDPYGSAEYVQNIREQFQSASGRQLVLEMEPAELGKVSIKVEAKKDEISVMALTDNESARQALVKNSPELRQNLQDQGLVLDKFTVDVNQDKAGGGNYPADDNPGGRNQVSRTVKSAGTPGLSGSSYIRQIDVRSQISIFA